FLLVESNAARTRRATAISVLRAFIPITVRNGRRCALHQAKLILVTPPAQAAFAITPEGTYGLR
ncbi:MAG: hypothetical protein OER77_16085, partial [Myxococcales bacterium]|nr:hypothetical protein [Myxococcales bacterium]